MSKRSPYAVKYNECSDEDLKFLDKNSSNLIRLHQYNFLIPDGFIVTNNTYIRFFKENYLQKKITDLLSTVHYGRADSLMQVSGHIKKLIAGSNLSDDLIYEINSSYRELGGLFKPAGVTIGALKKHVKGKSELILNLKKFWASQFDAKQLLFNHKSNRNNFDHGISVAVQFIMPSKKNGTLSTPNLEIETDSKLAGHERDEIKKIGLRYRKHFLLPAILSWAIHRRKIYITYIKPFTNSQKANLVLVRHGESIWNAEGLWTGWTDVELSGKGHAQAQDDGKKLKNIHFDIAYTSSLLRAIQTLQEIKISKDQLKIPTVSSKALNERDYGALTGKNKWDIKKEYGDEQFLKWRRGWDESIPQGETLKDVYNRVVPYYGEHILPELKSGKNVIISAHGNSLRALAKYLENISDEDISKFEIPVGQILIYQIDEDGKVVNKEIVK